MAKKIRFSLEMENGRKIRTLDELRENFSLTKVVEYFDDQKLFHWLEDRYYTEQVEKLKQLNREDADFYRKICHIFEVEYREKDEDIDEKLEVEKRKAQLKQFTDDKTVLEHVHQVAFNQDELYDLLDDNISDIYLCGEIFRIPLAKENVSYIGVNTPIIRVESQKCIDWEKTKIHIIGCRFDEEYQRLEKEKQKISIIENVENLHVLFINGMEYDDNAERGIFLKNMKTDEVTKCVVISKEEAYFDTFGEMTGKRQNNFFAYLKYDKKTDKKYVLALHLIDLISKEDKVICDDVMAAEGFKEKDINYKYWFEIDYIDSKKIVWHFGRYVYLYEFNDYKVIFSPRKISKALPSDIEASYEFVNIYRDVSVGEKGILITANDITVGFQNVVLYYEFATEDIYYVSELKGKWARDILFLNGNHYLSLSGSSDEWLYQFEEDTRKVQKVYDTKISYFSVSAAAENAEYIAWLLGEHTDYADRYIGHLILKDKKTSCFKEIDCFTNKYSPGFNIELYLENQIVCHENHINRIGESSYINEKKWDFDGTIIQDWKEIKHDNEWNFFANEY